MELHGVPHDQIRAWLPFVGAALEYMAQKSNGRLLACDLVDLLEARDMQMWLAMDGNIIKAVMLTEIIKYPRKKALRAVGGVGRDWKMWSHLYKDIIEWGKQNGCDLFEVYALRKWRHMFPEFTEFHVMLELKQ